MNADVTEKEWLRTMVMGKTAIKKKDEQKDSSLGGHTEPQEASKTVPLRGFNDVAGMEELKGLVTEGLINVLRNPECAKAYCIKPPTLLFYGPMGCGKTFFATKVAEELNINFMEVNPDDIASSLVHGTQSKIGELFRKAEKKAPTLLFFDEFDAMVPKRTGEDRGLQNGEVNEFLCMLNNAADKGVYILAATNHPELIDKAVLRTGRIDEVIYIDMPDYDARKELFKLALSKIPAATDIDYEKLAEMTKGYNCSDIDYIVKVASRNMFNESIKDKQQPYKLVSQSLLEETIGKRTPSVSEKDLREFERVRNEFSSKDKKNRTGEIGFH